MSSTRVSIILIKRRKRVDFRQRLVITEAVLTVCVVWFTTRRIPGSIPTLEQGVRPHYPLHNDLYLHSLQVALGESQVTTVLNSLRGLQRRLGA